MVGVEGLEPPTHGLGNPLLYPSELHAQLVYFRLLTTCSPYANPLVDDADNEETGSFSLPQARLVRTVLRLFALDASARIARACVVNSSIELY